MQGSWEVEGEERERGGGRGLEVDGSFYRDDGGSSDV